MEVPEGFAEQSKNYTLKKNDRLIFLNQLGLLPEFMGRKPIFIFKHTDKMRLVFKTTLRTNFINVLTSCLE